MSHLHFSNKNWVPAFLCLACGVKGNNKNLKDGKCPVCAGAVNDQHMGLYIEPRYDWFRFFRGKPLDGYWTLIERKPPQYTPPIRTTPNIISVIPFESFFNGLPQMVTSNKGSNHHAVMWIAGHGIRRHQFSSDFCKHRYAITAEGLVHHCPVANNTRIIPSGRIHAWITIPADGVPTLECLNDEHGSRLLAKAFNVGGRCNYEDSMKALREWQALVKLY